MDNLSDREHRGPKTIEAPFLAKISQRGQIAVPSEVRELAHIAPGDILELVLVRVYRPNGSDPRD